jgi:hypothetical protein
VGLKILISAFGDAPHIYSFLLNCLKQMICAMNSSQLALNSVIFKYVGRPYTTDTTPAKGMHRNTIRRIIDQRARTPFRGLNDFFSRVQPAEDEAGAMVHCGALL